VREYAVVAPPVNRRQAEGFTPAARTVRDTALSALAEAGIPPGRVARTERLLATAILGFAVSEVAGRFRERDQDTIDEDFAELMRWLTMALAELRQLRSPNDRPARIRRRRTRAQRSCVRRSGTGSWRCPPR
jgi:hypothetical protein